MKSIDLRTLKVIKSFERKATTGEVARALGVDSAGARQSLLRLKTKGLVAFERAESGRKSVSFWFYVGKSRVSETIAALRRLGKATAKELAQEVGESVNVISRRLLSLVNSGEVCFMQGEKSRVYYLSEELFDVEEDFEFSLEGPDIFSLFYKKPPSKAGREFWLSPPGASGRPPQRGRLGKWS